MSTRTRFDFNRSVCDDDNRARRSVSGRSACADCISVCDHDPAVTSVTAFIWSAIAALMLLITLTTTARAQSNGAHASLSVQAGTRTARHLDSPVSGSDKHDAQALAATVAGAMTALRSDEPASTQPNAAQITLRDGADVVSVAGPASVHMALHIVADRVTGPVPKALEFLNSAQSLAGVRHFVVVPNGEAVENTRRILRTRGIFGPRVVADPDHTISTALKVTFDPGSSDHLMVLIAPDGRFETAAGGAVVRINEPFARFNAIMTAHQANPAKVEYNLDKSGIAINGYDPVSYFDNRPLQGSSAIQSVWRGVTYQFASAENRARFNADPVRFAPQYGGWCATAIADNKKVEIDPTNYKVTNNRLFLFYKGWLGNARNDWVASESSLTGKADGQWKKLAPGDDRIGLK